jgi:hypothetical protein
MTFQSGACITSKKKKWCVHPQDRHHVRGRQIMGKCVSDGWIYLFDLKNRNFFIYLFILFFCEFGTLYFKRVIVKLFKS